MLSPRKLSKGMIQSPGSINFDATIKVKEEKLSDDESITAKSKFHHVLKKTAMVKLQPIDSINFIRTSPSKACKSDPSKKGNSSTRQFHANGSIVDKSAEQGNGKTNILKKDAQRLQPTRDKRPQRVVQSNGLTEVKTSPGSNKKGNILQDSYVVNDRNTNLPPCPSGPDPVLKHSLVPDPLLKHPLGPDPVLKPNDLRHIIGSHKKAIKHTAVVDSLPNGDKHSLDGGDDENNDIDSMSLHADDDLELGNNEDLNKLGKHFELANSDMASQSPIKTNEKCTKRRHSDQGYHSPKKNRVDSQHQEFSRSRPSVEGTKTQGKDNKDAVITAEVREHSKSAQNSARADGRYSDDKQRSDATRKDAGKPQNNRTSAHSVPVLNHVNHTEVHTKMPNFRERGQNMERRNFPTPLMNIPPRNTNDCMFPAPQPMPGIVQGIIPGVQTPNVHRPFFPNQHFHRGNRMSVRPSPPYNIRSPTFGSYPGPIGNNFVPHMHQLTDQTARIIPPKIQQIFTRKNFESCISVCEECISEIGKVPIVGLETLLKQAAEENVTNLNSKVISYLVDLIRKEREPSFFKLEDIRFAAEAYIKVEDLDSAIDLVLQCKKRGFEVSQKILLQIRNAVFASPVKHVDNLVRLCDELDGCNLLNKRVLEEVLRHMSIGDLRARTKSLKVLEMLQEFPVPEKGIQSLKFQSTNPGMVSEVSYLIKQIDEISAQERIPPDLLVKLIHSVRTSSEALLVITKLSELPGSTLTSIPAGDWNAFLIETCNSPFADVQFANQVHGIITDYEIPLNNRSLLEFATLLLRDGKESTCKAALDIIDRIHFNGITVEDVTDGISNCLSSVIGNKILCSASREYKIVMILLKSKQDLPEGTLNNVMNTLKFDSCYQEIYEIILELENCDVNTSMETFELAASALEDWEAGADPFLHVIKLIKKRFPSYRIFKDSASVVSSLSVSSGNAQNAALLPSPLLCKDAVVPSGSEARLVRSAPAIPLKSPFEEFLHKDHSFSSEKNEPLHLSIDIGRAEKAANAVEETVLDEDAILNKDEETVTALPTSSSRPAECMDSSEYQQLYNKMVVAAGAQNSEEVFQLYTELRRSGVAIGNDVLLELYKALVVKNPSESFKSFAEIIQQSIPLVQAISDEDSFFLFHDIDQETLGRLGVRLLFCYIEQGDLAEGYQLLYLLHELNINYSLYGLGFDGGRSRTACEIAMAAVQVCMNKDPPALDGAMEVLRGANFPVPLKSEDDTEHKVVLKRLTNDLIEKDEFNDACEVMYHSHNERGWSLDSSEYFNELLLRFSEESNSERASKVYDFIIGNKGIVLSHKAFRAYLNCQAREGNTSYAKELFEKGREMEVYPSQTLTDPYFFELPCNLTQIEMKFMLEEHLRRIRRTVYEGEGNIKPLMGSQSAFKILFKENYELFETSKEQFAIAKENMIVVLSEMMNPALKIIETENPDEPLVIAVNSICGWYEERAPTKRHLSVASDIGQDSTRRTVEMSNEYLAEPSVASHNGPLYTTSNGLLVPHDVTNNNFIVNQLTGEVCERLKHYLQLGRVEEGKPFEECCITLIKLYRRVYKNCKLEDYDAFRNQVSVFVDNFFQSHGKFVPKRCFK